jgi:hypothetical protein
MNRLLLGYSPDFDIFDDLPRGLRSRRTRAQREAAASHADDPAQAAELLEAADHGELHAALTRLLRGAAGTALRPAVEAGLVRLLRHAAAQALPSPGARSRDAPARASRFFGIELEGLSPEDQEFESARRFVQLVEDAARHAAAAPGRLAPPSAALWAAAQAAKRHAPGWRSVRSPIAASIHRSERVTAGAERPFPIQGAQHA